MANGRFFLGALILSILPGCYVTKLAMTQTSLLASRQSIVDVLQDPNTSPEVRQKLSSLQGVLAFAQAHGLNTEDAYRYYIELPGDSVSFVVYAAQADRLEAKTWWFPVVGRVPYLGFFEAGERDEKAEALRSEGFDTYSSGVSAFSSLGWFHDPIYSSMLKRSEASLAHLIFHELTHRTYWYPGSVEFNENLAEYVGEYLTIKFLESKGDRAKVEAYVDLNEDRKLFKEWIQQVRNELKTFYQTHKNIDQKGFLAAKQAIFERLTVTMKPKFRRFDLVGSGDWNNARVLAVSLYSPDTERFEKAHRCLGDPSMPHFFASLKRASEEISEQFQALDSLCQSSNKTISQNET
jgi:predicted aminopeptidase